VAASGTRIRTAQGRVVLDSRGHPTVEAMVELEGGAVGRAKVPSGASTGAHEALELRDGGRAWGGRGVTTAVGHVGGAVLAAIRGIDATDVAAVDGAMREADGTPNLARLGANAVLAASLASARAAARATGEPFYRFAARAFGEGAIRMPVPMLNVINGGAHADNALDVQEFMIAPVGFERFSEALRAGTEIYHALRRSLSEKGLSTAVGDEGGFAPQVSSAEQALDLLVEAVRGAGYAPGEGVLLAVDVAATEFAEDGRYDFEKEKRDAAAMTGIYERWLGRYPIYSIEDGLAEDDWAGWRAMTRRLGSRAQLVGDDLFVTNPERLARGVQEGVANAVLVKPNQIGTLTDTFRCVRAAYAAGYSAVMSHRSGETEDTTIADLAVALGTGQIKTGAPCRAERTAKYNRLLRIEADLTAAGSPPPFGRPAPARRR
jgi:enolase